MLEAEAGDVRKAITTFRSGLQIDPLSLELNENLALALKQSGDYSGAKQAAELTQSLRR